MKERDKTMLQNGPRRPPAPRDASVFPAASKQRNPLMMLVAMLTLVLAFVLPGCGGTGTNDVASPEGPDEAAVETVEASDAIDEGGTYTTKEDVALYLHTYGHLPSNFVTKEEAEDAGWKTEGLSLEEACPGKSIGGDRFGNREGRLPAADGRTYWECDIDYDGGQRRGAKRIVYSNDGLVFYTEDHYRTFEQLY